MKVGNKIKSKNASWSFRGQVFKNFDNHISKSIPLYFETINLYENLSDFFIMDKSNVIDIGCSTGTFLQKINKRHLNNLEKKIFLKGYDVVPEMLNYAKKKIKTVKLIFLQKML